MTYFADFAHRAQNTGSRPASTVAALAFATLSALFLVSLMAALPIQAETQEPAAEQASEEAPEAAPDQVQVPTTRVALAQFTTGIEDREPIDQITFVENEIRKIYFYTDLRGFEGQTIKHRWLHNGTVMADVAFEVRGPRWRVWSSKALLPDWIGDWTVEIVAAEGEVIAAETFTHKAPGA